MNDNNMKNQTPLKERFFLIGITPPHGRFEFGEQTLEELRRLTDTAGAEIVGEEHVRVREINPATFIGSGTAQRLAGISSELEATGIVFDEDLSPAQNRNLENIFDAKVLDRSSLILDIFAQHAHSSEGKLQVELAQLEYLLPRLRGRGQQLSRLGGGIGTRGPGETKLETDRRRILKRISRLKSEIDAMKKNRDIQRSRREKKSVPTVSLVGYTNAGKSTLLNTLTRGNVLVQNQLFSTLDPTARKLDLPAGGDAVLIDTVGLIRKLPHTLVAAFRATLEEIRYADILLCIVDASSPMREEEIRATHEVLEIMKVRDKPILTVFNKIDSLEDRAEIAVLAEDASPSVLVSAKSGEMLYNLLRKIEYMIIHTRAVRQYEIPYHRFDLLAKIQSLSDDAEVEYLDDHILVTTRIEQKEAARLEQDEDLGIVREKQS